MIEVGRNADMIDADYCHSMIYCIGQIRNTRDRVREIDDVVIGVQESPEGLVTPFGGCRVID